MNLLGNKYKISFGRLLLAAILIFLQPLNTLAQSNYYVENEREFFGGVIAGTNLSQIEGDGIAGYNKVGANVGAIVYARLKGPWAASMEILYSQKGSLANYSQQIDYTLTLTHYSINLNYAEIPVLINVFDKHKNHASFGLSYSRLVGSTEGITTIPYHNFNFNAYPFQQSDFNIVAGAWVHIKKGLFVNLRFQYSLVSIREIVPPEFNNTDQYNNMWVIRLMYLFM